MIQNHHPNTSYFKDYQGRKFSQTGGPFTPGNSSKHYNLGLLILIFPAVLASILGRGPEYLIAVAIFTTALGGSLLGTALGTKLFRVRSENSKKIKFDGIWGGIWGGILFFQFWDFQSQFLAMLGLGLVVGFLNTWPRGAGLPGFPALVPTLLAGVATTLAYFAYPPQLLPTPLLALVPTTVYASLQSGWVVVMVATLAGAALGKTLLTPSFSSGVLNFSLGKALTYSMIMSFLVVISWVWYKYEYQYQAQGILDGFPILILALLPTIVVGIFWITPPWLIWRSRQKIIRLHSKNTSDKSSLAITNKPVPTDCMEQKNRPTLRCGHLGTAPKTATWEGFSSCAQATSHDMGFLLCPYGCLALGDCSRSCPTGAIYPTESGFPVFNKNLCSNCGNCLKSCPKNLWVLASHSKKVFIPCAAQSSLKKNAAYCEHSCLGCGKCRKACPAKAISREGAIRPGKITSQEKAMVVNQEQCLSHGESCQQICASVCPRGIMNSQKL